MAESARMRDNFNYLRERISRLLPAGSWRSMTFLLIIVVNLVLIALYFWSRGGATTMIRVEAEGQQFRAYVDGRLVHERAFQAETQGGIGLLLSRHYRLPALPDPNGVDWVRVTDIETGAVLFEDDFNGDSDPLWEDEARRWRTEDGLFNSSSGNAITTGFQPWGDVVVEARLRNITEATLYVRVQDARNAVVLGIGPFRNFGGATLARLEDGTSVERADLARLELDRGQTLRSMTAMLLRPYPLALVTIIGITVLAFVVRIRRFEQTLQAAGRLVSDLATGVVVGLAVGTAVLLWYLLYVIGDAMPHVPDSVLYVFQSKIFASFNVTASAPPARESFSIFNPHMMQIVDGRWFSHYPFGHPLVLTAGQLFGTPWLIPPLLGALSVGLLYAMGRHLYGVSVGLAAAVLLFSSPFFLMHGSNFMSHNTAAFTLIGALFLYVVPQRRRLPAMLAAGVLIGLLFNIRPLTAVAFLPVLGAFMAMELWQASARARVRRLLPGLFAIVLLVVLVGFWGSAELPRFVVLALLLALGAIACALAYPLVRDRSKCGTLFREDVAFSLGALLLLGMYFLYNKATTGSFTTTAYEIQGTFDENFFGFGGVHSLTLGIQNSQELLSLMLLVANGWPLAVGLIVAALPFILGSRNKWDYFFGACFLTIATAPMFYRSSAIMHGPRFWYESLPFLIVLTARGAQYVATSCSTMADWLANKFWKDAGTTSNGLTTLVSYSLIAALVGLSIYSWMFGQRPAWGNEDIGVREFTPESAAQLEGFNFTDDRLIQEADRMDLQNALVFVEQCPQWWCYGSVFWTNSPSLDGDIVWAEQQASEDDLVVLERYPERTVYLASYRTPGTIVETERQDIIEAVEERLAEEPDDVPSTITTTPEERDQIRLEQFPQIGDLLDRYALLNGEYPNTDNQRQSLCAYRTLDVACEIETIGPIPIDPLQDPIQRGYWYVSDGETYTIIALSESGVESPDPCPEGLFGEDDELDRLCYSGPKP